MADRRSLHAKSQKPLVRDKYAKHFITASADPYLTALLVSPPTTNDPIAFPGRYGVPTRCFDEFFLSAADEGIGTQ